MKIYWTLNEEKKKEMDITYTNGVRSTTHFEGMINYERAKKSKEVVEQSKSFGAKKNSMMHLHWSYTLHLSVQVLYIPYAIYSATVKLNFPTWCQHSYSVRMDSGGKISTFISIVDHYSSVIVSSMLSKDGTILQLWKLDVLSISDPYENKSCEENVKYILTNFLETVKRNKNGRYEVYMPSMEGYHPLASNFDMADRILDNFIKIVQRDDFFDNVFDEWLEV